MSTSNSSSGLENLELWADSEARLLLSVRVQPRSSRTAIDGIVEGALKVRLQAPPVDGAANAALLKFLGRKVLGVAPSSLEIVRGAAGRNKTVAISELSEQRIREALATHL